MAKAYSAQEVALHSDEKDLWMVIHGGVYDLTQFLKEHPGGEEVLVKLAGQNGTVCFDEIGHSEEAIQLRENYKIGVCSDATCQTEVSKKQSSQQPSTSDAKQQPSTNDDDWEYEEPEKETSFWLPVFIGLGVLIYAVIFYYLYY